MRAAQAPSAAQREDRDTVFHDRSMSMHTSHMIDWNVLQARTSFAAHVHHTQQLAREPAQHHDVKRAACKHVEHESCLDLVMSLTTDHVPMGHGSISTRSRHWPPLRQAERRARRHSIHMVAAAKWLKHGLV